MSVIHIDIWMLLAATVGGFSFLLWAVYNLLMYVSKLTINGIHSKMDQCKTDLEIKIDRAQSCAENCCERAGRIEKTLMASGVNALTGRKS